MDGTLHHHCASLIPIGPPQKVFVNKRAKKKKGKKGASRILDEVGHLKTAEEAKELAKKRGLSTSQGSDLGKIIEGKADEVRFHYAYTTCKIKGFARAAILLILQVKDKASLYKSLRDMIVEDCGGEVDAGAEVCPKEDDQNDRRIEHIVEQAHDCVTCPYSHSAQ